MGRAVRLLLDVTATESSDLQTGIQRVTIELVRQLILEHRTPGAVCAVYLKQVKGRWQHWQANRFEHRVLGTPGQTMPDEPIQIEASDMLLHLDLATTSVAGASAQGLYNGYQARGVRVLTVVHDLLPIRLPDCFPRDTAGFHRQWLCAIASFDGALCVSQHVAQDLKNWYQETDMRCELRIGSFRLGSDIGTFSAKLPPSEQSNRVKLKRFGVDRIKTFLMVGTIEPRKGHSQALDAFETLWDLGYDYRLIIVGRQGWTHLPLNERMVVASLVYRMQQHPERFRKLIWLSDADDVALERAYQEADCLLAASLGEGFGLPLTEAAHRGLPVLARDLPVFREVASANTQFFTTESLCEALKHWHPSTATPDLAREALSWKDSAKMVQTWLDQTFKNTEGCC